MNKSVQDNIDLYNKILERIESIKNKEDYDFKRVAALELMLGNLSYAIKTELEEPGRNNTYLRKYVGRRM